MNRAYIFLGSNIERENNYLEALRRLASLGRVVAVSSVYDTAPVGGEGDNFFNGAALLETRLGARELKRGLHEIEAQLGRARSSTADPNAPRTIDLDLVLYNREKMDDGDLRIPDPLTLERPFMAAALAELSPEYIHPSSALTLRQIAERLTSDRELKIDPEMTTGAKNLVGKIYRGETTHA